MMPSGFPIFAAMKLGISFSDYQIKAVRSGGSGGQHVNKVSSRVELYFDIQKSISLTEEEKETLLRKLKSKLTDDGVLRLTEDGSRSQHANREAVVKKLHTVIAAALRKPKKRVPTKVSAAAKKKRLDTKKRTSEKKSLRKKDW